MLLKKKDASHRIYCSNQCDKKTNMFLNCVSLENNLKDYGIIPTHTLAEYPFKTIETL